MKDTAEFYLQRIAEIISNTSLDDRDALNGINDIIADAVDIGLISIGEVKELAEAA